MIYTHVMKIASGGTGSPLDALPSQATGSVPQIREPSIAYA